MTPTAPKVKVAESYVNTLNSNSQTNVSPTNPVYNKTMGDKNMYTLLARLGPEAIYSHIMKAAFDPVYGREFSLAQQHEKPVTNHPLAEDRPNERSENVNLISLIGGYHKKTENGSNPLKNTVVVYDSKKKGDSYSTYSKQYTNNYKKEETKNTNGKGSKGKNIVYKISSMVEALEQKGKEVFKEFYDPNNNDTTADIITNSRPYEIKKDYVSGSGGTHNPKRNEELFGEYTLEERVKLLIQ
ncbi:MAG: hypothetical protein QF798_03620 [Candidatus Woesearchaeota archaeon]|nr:hypothetical protein [Candidatus Woesearchaeota archaeon]